MVVSYRDQQKAVLKRLRNEARITVSIVPMQVNFCHDKKKCLTSIVFVPDDLAKKIEQTIIEPLRKIDPYHHYLLTF